MYYVLRREDSGRSVVGIEPVGLVVGEVDRAVGVRQVVVRLVVDALVGRVVRREPVVPRLRGGGIVEVVALPGADLVLAVGSVVHWRGREEREKICSRISSFVFKLFKNFLLCRLWQKLRSK